MYSSMNPPTGDSSLRQQSLGFSQFGGVGGRSPGIQPGGWHGLGREAGSLAGQGGNAVGLLIVAHAVTSLPDAVTGSAALKWGAT